MQKIFSPTVPTNIGENSSNIDEDDSYYVQLNIDKIKKFVNSDIKKDSEYSGFKNTQEINIDWSRFENHTFFNSAQSKVSIAFDKIINEFPFDGTEIEILNFRNNLTGFEKYVYDQFPFSTGSLLFSGSVYPENGNNGTYLIVKDNSGNEFSNISRDNTGTQKLNFNKTPVSIQFNIFLPQITNNNQTIFQKQNGNNLGFAAYVSQSFDVNYANILFYIGSGSYLLSSSVNLEKGKFHSLCFSLDRNNKSSLFTYKNDGLYSKSQNIITVDSFSNNSQLIIGSGSNWSNQNKTLFAPKETFSGSLDEFKIYDKFISVEEFLESKDKNVYAENNLKLYYKFNEPAIEISTDDKKNAIVLDSSGNSLHSYIYNTAFFKSNYSKLRCPTEFSNSIKNEILEYSPVLFTSHPEIISLSENLLTSASLYDLENPNLITKLVPQHYLTLGRDIENRQNEYDGLGEEIIKETLPTEADNNNIQILLTFLYTFAKFFDELKLYTDVFSRVLKIDYNSENSVPDQFIDLLYEYFGFKTPNIFNDSTLDAYISGEKVLEDYTKTIALKKIKHEILKRILVSLPEITKSKGTIRAIESYIRALGIEPNTNFKIKEYGGPLIRPIKNVRVKIPIVLPVINLTGSEIIRSLPLSGSRIEPGIPDISGIFVEGISNNENDGLYTSGSWTFESLYKFKNKKGTASPITQSLARMYVTGSSLETPGYTFNLVAHRDLDKNYNNHNITLYARPGWDSWSSNNSPLLVLSSNVDIYDGDIWHVSFGKKRRNSSENEFLSSSYFISVTKQFDGEIFEQHYDELFFNESLLNNSSLSKKSSLFNSSGSMVELGNSNIINNSNGYYLNSINVPQSAKAATFNGEVSQIRFWSKALTIEEIKEHTKNYNSVGVEKSSINYNFSNKNSGSFERIIFDCNMNQDEKTTDTSGNIQLFDYSQNNLHLSGINFANNISPFLGENVIISHLSYDIDSLTTSDKIRVRSYEDLNNSYISDYSRQSPVYELEKNDIFLDSPNLSIELSITDALNSDIIKIFATLDQIENILGSPEQLFSYEYKDLESLRQIYFNRLTEKINIKSFYDLFKWFDDSMNKFILQIIPRKTKFLGVNFVLEQHLLERSKYQHKMYSQYLNDKRTPIITQLTGFLGRTTYR